MASLRRNPQMVKLWRSLNAHPKLVAAAAVLAACLYVAPHLDKGWIPHDEGQLGQAAERALAGELPHRDFDDMYTGGLTLLNALAFRWFGVDSLSLRWMLGLWFVPTIAAFHYLASRAAPPVIAAAATLLAAMVSLPVYSAPMPSWYNLFLAILGTAALIRHVETDRARWIFAAGLCGGLSLLFKITGLFFIAASLLALVYREQVAAKPQAADCATPKLAWYSWLTAGALALFGALGLAFLRSSAPEMNLLHFTLPLAALAAYLIYEEFRVDRGLSWPRFARLAANVLLLGVGVALPVLGLVGYYARADALPALYEGVFVLPRMRTENGAFPLPGIGALLASVAFASVLAMGLRPATEGRRKFESRVLIACAAVLALSGTQVGFFLGFQALRNLTPVLLVLGLAMLLQADRLQLDVCTRQRIFIAGATAALCSLVQYPHAYGIYFFYAAPLVALAALYIAAYQPWPLRRALAGLLVFALVFAALRLNGPDPHANVAWLGRVRAMEPMGLIRCSLEVPAEEAEAHRELVATIQAHSTTGASILATPDCPEVYFLANRTNPAGVFYEFFRPDWLACPEDLCALVREHDVDVVVVSGYPCFSPRPNAELVAAVEQRFPHMQPVMMTVSANGRQIERFRVYWRD